MQLYDGSVEKAKLGLFIDPFFWACLTDLLISAVKCAGR